jgi:DNA repair photolyase
VRWDRQRLSGRSGAGADQPAELALFGPDACARTFDTPEFRDMTFYEIHAKSLLNKVPSAARVPFDWTINPYRGCGHACVYCFARRTHEYLDLDAGHDFDTKVIVKVNAAAVLRRELARPSWRGEPVAMGTNVDCYQRAEGRYALMPEIIAALRDAGNPFSILTKGTLLLRDLDLLRAAARVTDVGLSVSVGSVDAGLWRRVEPGTPSPRARLRMVRTLTDAGFRVGVLMAPILPHLGDSPGRLEETVRAIAESGASSLTPLVLHLRPGAREWYHRWLAREHPDLVPVYRDLYGSGSYAQAAYRRRISATVAMLARRHGVGTDRDSHRNAPHSDPPPSRPG